MVLVLKQSGDLAVSLKVLDGLVSICDVLSQLEDVSFELSDKH